MSTDIDWRSELDRSFGTGHDLPPGHYVAAGRSAVRRRRAASLALVAAMVVGVGAAWASGPGGPPRSDAPVATQPPAPTETRDTQKRDERVADATAQESEPFFASGPATLGEDGLVLAPGAGPVLERIRNPMGYTPAQGQSLAIRVMFEDRETYSLLVRHADGGTSMGSNDATGDFTGWLAGRVATQHQLDVLNGVLEPQPTRTPGDPTGWLALGPDGDVVPADGVVLVEQVTDPDLGDGFAPAGAQVGAVRVVVDERPYYAVYRVIDGKLDVIAPLSDFDSMSAFVAWARQQYASGEGLR